MKIIISYPYVDKSIRITTHKTFKNIKEKTEFFQALIIERDLPTSFHGVEDMIVTEVIQNRVSETWIIDS